MKGLEKQPLAHNGVKLCPDCGNVSEVNFAVTIEVNGKAIQITNEDDLCAIGQIVCLESIVDSTCSQCGCADAFTVDPSMVEVITKMNNLGYTTEFSCCGADSSHDTCIPYIAFILPKTQVRLLEIACRDSNLEWYFKDKTSEQKHYLYDGYSYSSYDVSFIEDTSAMEMVPGSVTSHLGITGKGKMDVTIEQESRNNDDNVRVLIYNNCEEVEAGWEVMFKLMDMTIDQITNPGEYIKTHNEEDYGDLTVPLAYQIGKVYYIQCDQSEAEDISEAYEKCGAEYIGWKYSKPKDIVNAIKNFAHTGFIIDIGWHREYSKEEIEKFGSIARMLGVSINFMGPSNILEYADVL